MKKKFIEESVLFISIIKWLLLASCIGAIVGFSTTAFLKALDHSLNWTSDYDYFYLLLPVALLLSTLTIKYLAPGAKGHGTEKVIEAVHKHSGRIKLLVVPVKLVATVITIATGGSAGKEGPCAQIGAGLASAFADLFRFGDRDRKKLVICGISAGFSTVFGTPIAGAIFGVEVLFVGGLLYEVLLPSFVAGIVGYQVSSALGVTYFHEPLNFVPDFTSVYFIRVCMSGIFFGICSLLFVEILRFFEWLAKRIQMNDLYKAFCGGAVLAVLALIFSTRYLGLGLDTIESALSGEKVPVYAFFLKMVFTSITLAFGGSGGIITPIFFVGASSGSAFADIFGLSRNVFAAIGMVCLVAGAANTPISASIMAVELFGPRVAPYAAVACVISFLMTGHRSVYPSQVLSMSKTTSIKVDKGKEMKDIEDVEFSPRDKSISGSILKGIEKIKKDR
ncbi:MAG: chloride channel protein [Nitrospirota bacterium]